MLIVRRDPSLHIGMIRMGTGTPSASLVPPSKEGQFFISSLSPRVLVLMCYLAL